LAERYDKLYSEYYARAALGEISAARYSCLQRRDRPDLQCAKTDVGVEVTRAFTGERTAEPARLLLDPSPRQAKPAHIYYDDGKRTNVQWQAARGYAHIVDAVKRKIDKINDNGYTHFAEFELFVITQTTGAITSQEDFSDIARQSQAYQEDKPIRFTRLYVLDGGRAYSCCFDNALLASEPFTDAQLELFHTAAQRSTAHELAIPRQAPGAQ
jgi:hypothetical protein